ncbi:hypothetical protein [Candidatus Palauibacter sp.]|uniref:hypothetical protein n=1 Tax=Candidatus Palauibacter sp. TaxID=3101350 RepID=UPI003B019770
MAFFEEHEVKVRTLLSDDGESSAGAVERVHRALHCTLPAEHLRVTEQTTCQVFEKGIRKLRAREDVSQEGGDDRGLKP